MPATKQAPEKARTAKAGKPQAAETARARCEADGRVIDRIADSLDVAQRDLKALSGSLGSGAGDLRKDVARLLRDARRDVTKLSKSVRRDLERLQRDLTTARGGNGRGAHKRS
jgi:hypothetical protein